MRRKMIPKPTDVGDVRRWRKENDRCRSRREACLLLKISQSQSVRERAFRSAEERNEHIRYLVNKCEGLYIFYKLWIAAKILDITKDEMKLLVKDRTPGG